MEVTVYGENINLKKEYETVGEIIDAVEARNCVITKIVADEKDVTDFTGEELERIKPIEHLEILAKQTKKLILESLEEGESYLPRLIDGIDNIVTAFSQGNEREGYNLLEQALEGLGWINSVIANLDKISLTFMNKEEVKKLNEVINSWQEVIQELLDAFENQDTVLMNDILEYELKPVLEDLQEIVRKINKNS